MNLRNLLEVDWTRIPAPEDDGAASHLPGTVIPPIDLIATAEQAPQTRSLRRATPEDAQTAYTAGRHATDGSGVRTRQLI